MNEITDFTAEGWIGTLDFSTKGISPCFVLLQVQGGEYVRLYPEEPGTFDCDPGNLVPWSGDSSAEYRG